MPRLFPPDYLDNNVHLLANRFKGGIALPTDHHRPDHGTSVLPGTDIAPRDYLTDHRTVEGTLYFNDLHRL
jgi:hypothetical protein